MLNLNEVAQWLTTVFNEIGAKYEPKYTFNIYAEVGEDKNNVDVQGIYKVDIPNNLPVNGIVNAKYFGRIDLTVSAPRTNYNLANVEQIVGDVAKKINGTEKVFGNGKGFVIMSVTGTGNFKTEYSQGNIVPLLIKLDINYSENVVVGGGKHWYISEIGGEYIEIPFITERVTVEKDGKVSPINDRKYKQAFMLAQQRSYMFALPYDTNVGAMLTKDILTGDANKNYMLKCVDNVAFTEEKPFETRVVLYRNGDNGETKPDTSMLNLIFTDADDGKNSTKYALALIDNPFDGATENTRWFDNQSEQQNWYQVKINNGADFDSIDAPNLNNLVLTNQIYKNTRNYDIFDLVNKNYAIIKVTKGENEPQYYYYKVANADIGANSQVIYTLQLDSVQTWLFRNELIVDDSFINKCHIDRWIDNGDGTVSFDLGKNSKLFEREELRDVAMRLKTRTKLKYDYTISDNNLLVDWLNENVIAWVYVLMRTDDYNVYNSVGTLKASTFGNTKILGINKLLVDYPQVTLVYPIIDGNKQIEFYSSIGNVFFQNLNEKGLNDFLKENGGFSKVFNIKLSVKPPFNLNKKYNYTIRDNNLRFVVGANEDTTQYRILYPSEIVGEYRSFVSASTFRKENNLITANCVMCYVEDYKDPVRLRTNLTLPTLRFDKTDFNDNTLADKKYNPKINSSDYKSLRVTYAGGFQDFPIDKMNKQIPTFDYIEQITLDCSKILVRPFFETDGVFNYMYSTSFNGLNFTNDFSIPFAQNQLDLYIANNKNAYLSFSTQQQYARASNSITNQMASARFGVNAAFSALKTGVSAGTSIATGNIGGAITSGVGGGMGILESGANTALDVAERNQQLDLRQAYERAQFDFTIDNMRNAPDTLANANGGALFTMAVDDFGVYAELYEGLDTELESANDIMMRDGYNLNRFEEPNKTIKDYCHTRRYFNYIKAVIGNIRGVPMSDTMRADLRNRFSNGIRFWHQDTIDYSHENYELNLASN